MFNQFVFRPAGPENNPPAEDNDGWQTVVDKFRHYCKPRKNTVYERHCFWSRNQGNGELIDQWIKDLRIKAKLYEFGDQEDLMIRDKIVFSVNDERVKERLLRESDLSLSKAVDVCRAADTTRAQLKAMTSEAKVDIVRQRSQTFCQDSHVGGMGKTNRGTNKYTASSSRGRPGPPATQGNIQCKYCCRSHPAKSCPAYGKRCNRCKGWNHFAIMHEDRTAIDDRQVRMVNNEQYEDNECLYLGSNNEQYEDKEFLYLGSIYLDGHAHASNDDDWMTKMVIGRQQISCKLDTGAQANVLPMKVFEMLTPRVELQPTQTILSAFVNGVKVKPAGTVTLQCIPENADVPMSIEFFVTNHTNLPLLGCRTCEVLGLVKRVCEPSDEKPPMNGTLINDYQDVFTGVGELEQPCDIELRDDIQPVIQATRKLPYTRVESLDKIEKDGIVADVDKATRRVNNLVLTEKRNVPGKHRNVADAQSRAYIEDEADCGFIDDIEVRVHSVTQNFPGSSEQLEQIRCATAEDATLQRLYQVVMNGWPELRRSVQEDVRPYWNMRDEMSTSDGLLFEGERIVIPESMRQEMLQLLHEPHVGMEKTKSRARTAIFWPGMSRAIEDTVAKCSTCLHFARSNPKEPMIAHEIPDGPFVKVAMDIMSFKGREYLVAVDYYSKFPELALLENKTSECVIAHVKSISARHGIPEEIVADNQPFGSYAFRQFAKSWGIKVTTSSPTYAQSNGQAERAVQTLKSLLAKADAEGRDPYIAMLEYRNTPISRLRYAPAQLAMSRLLRSKLPSSSSVLQSRVVNSDRRSAPASSRCEEPSRRIVAQPSRRVVAQPSRRVVAQPSRRVVAQPSRKVVVQPPLAVVAQSESPPGVVAQSESPPGVVAQSESPPGVVAQSESPPGFVARSESPPGVVAQSESPPGVVALPPSGVVPQSSPGAAAKSPRRAVNPSGQTERRSRYGRIITNPNRFDC